MLIYFNEVLWQHSRMVLNQARNSWNGLVKNGAYISHMDSNRGIRQIHFGRKKLFSVVFYLVTMLMEADWLSIWVTVNERFIIIEHQILSRKSFGPDPWQFYLLYLKNRWYRHIVFLNLPREIFFKFFFAQINVGLIKKYLSIKSHFYFYPDICWSSWPFFLEAKL